MVKFEKPKTEKEEEIEKPKIPPERIERATNLSEEAEKLAEQGYKDRDEAKIQQAREMLSDAYEMLEKKRWGEWQELTDEDWEAIKSLAMSEIEAKHYPVTGLLRMGSLCILSPERFEKEIKKNLKLKEKINEKWRESFYPTVEIQNENLFSAKALDPKRFQEEINPLIISRKNALENLENLFNVSKDQLRDIIFMKVIDPDWFEKTWSKRERDAIFETATKQVFLGSHLESFEKLFFHSLARLKLLNPERFEKSIPRQSIEKAILKGREQVDEDRKTKNWRAFPYDAFYLAVLQNDIEVDSEQGLIIHYPEKKKS